ncbi:SDR family oxidoreductase [Curvivirga sp.]|uniref:SDR family oxidoreductase n=1 Tax=Curvivirga sp. TaxID=2856848 RepID=UPI003B59306A
MNILEGKVAIITGASAGIGEATARLFASEGAKLVIGARREDKLNALAREIKNEGGSVTVLAGDVTSEDYNKKLVEIAFESYGKLDIAFNNAGTLGQPSAIADLSMENWQNIIQTNLTSGFLAAKYQIPAMQENGGSLIFTSSFVGYTAGIPMQSAYGASKAGMIGMMKCLAAEYGAQGIRVNALLPGGTDTDMAKEFGTDPAVQEFVRNIHALKRIAQPEEIAQSALYLASDASTFVTGSAMLVDGGVSINKT